MNHTLLQKAPTRQRTSLRVLAFFLVSIFAELFLFNWSAFLTRANTPIDYTGRLSCGPEIISNGDGSYHISSNQAHVELLEINTPVNYIRIDIEVLPDSYSYVQEAVNLQLFATDDGNAFYTSYPERTILHKLSKTQFIHLNASGQVGQIQINLNDLADRDVIFHSVAVNPQRPFLISPERVLLLFLLCVSLFLIRPSSRIWNISFNPTSRKQKWILCLLALAEIAFIIFIMKEVRYAPISDSPYTKLADALISGTPYLSDIPSEGLMSLSNPYDPSLRIAHEVPFMWDYAYFNGHYYVYFGVIPALLMHIPWKIITGTPLINHLDILLPGILCTFGIIYLIYQLCKKYFLRIPFFLMVLFTAVALHCSRMHYLCAHPDFYSIPKLCALMFSVWGLGLWLASIKDTGYLSAPHLAAGSLCMAAVAGCRPQLLMGSFLAIPLFWFSLLPNRQNRKRTGYWKSILCFTVPFILVAAGLMYYNQIRFGSPFDFGANYNLTTNDMTQRGLRLGRVPAGIFSYLFQFPSNTVRFPFLSPVSKADTAFQGVNIIDETYGGLLTGSLFLWASFLAFRRNGPVKSRSLRLLCILSLCSAFIIVGTDTMMAGTLESYMNDFAIFLILPAIIVLFSLYFSFETGQYQNSILLVLLILAAQALLFSLCHLFASSSIRSNSPLTFYKIYYFIQFWL